MVVNDSEKSQKVAKIFCCQVCHYKSSNKYDYNKHLTTVKHQNATNGSKMVVNDSEKSQKVANYKCECGKIYKYDSGYYRHNKKCSKNVIICKDEPSDKELIMILVKQNTELLEVIKNGTHNTTTNTNSHNKTFNLQFFLHLWTFKTPFI